MKDEIEILLRYCEEQWNHIRHLEDQRATFTNFVTVVTAGLLGFVVQQRLSKQSLPLTILVVILGITGAIASEKFYERYDLHKKHEEQWLSQINELVPQARLKELAKEASDKHNAEFSKMLVNLRVHHVWRIYHLLIALLGVAATAIIIAK